MDICHLEKRGVRIKITKITKGRVVLRGDVVKDDSGACAVFYSTRFVCVPNDCRKSKPDCVGQAAEAVSDHTQVKLEDAPRLLNIPKSECPDVWIRLPGHKWHKNLGKHLRSCGTSRTKIVRSRLQASCGRDSSWKFYWNLDGGLFHDSDFAGDLVELQINLRWCLVYF